jgi:Carboxypeptidase regulatory-like domain
MNLRNLQPLLALTTATILAFTVAVPALAQSAAAGTITGIVTDPQGAVIAGATITLTDLTTKAARSTASNKTGQYIFPNVPSGTYSATSTIAGFASSEIQSLVVSVGSQTTANFRMSIGAESTTISVQSSNADLQTMNASTGQTVDPILAESLPAIGRDVATFLTLQAGVTPGGNDAGTTQDQATFQLDGGSNSSDMDGTQGVYTNQFANSTTGGFTVGGNTAGPAGVMPMPQDSVEEFKVGTSGQTADFNNSSGSQSQVVTKRGHDQWHGTGYEYYLDSNIGANLWQNNFPGTGYSPKASYHYNRYGAAAGGPVLPTKFGSKTYLFANYEGFSYPAASTYERAVPSYEYLQLGQLTFGGTTYSASQLKAADPRGIGMNQTLASFYNSQLPVAPSGDAGSTGFTGATYAGVFDKSCGALSGSICDSVNVIGYRANVLTPQSSKFLATRMDHDFSSKWHMMASYRWYDLSSNLTTNQVDIGGVLPGDKMGVPTALTNRPQKPWYFVVGATTNISASLTNDFHYSYLRNYWQWKGAGGPPQISGAGGIIEPLGESSTNVLSPYNADAQDIRTRIWDGKDNFFRDDLTKLKGSHLIQVGGQFQHNWNYHQRTDNGASINYTPTYQLGDAGGGGNIAYASTGLGSVGAGTSAYARILDTYFGLVTDTQVANTFSASGASGGALTANPPYTPIGAHTTIPYYNIYATDTWHALPSLTLSYGLSYAIEMPPSERDGNQVMFTDVSGNAIHIEDWLAARQSAAAQGQVYNPEIGFALIHNVAGNRKYPYDPYYGAVSPRLAVAWNPTFTNNVMRKIFGDGSTVIRGGYGRIYGRINGDLEVLNPLLSPGLILATQCKAAQSSTSGSGGCNQTNFTDKTAYRFGVDGLSPVLASAPLPSTLVQPYHPGYDGPGVAIASPLDPTVRPNDVDTFNLSIQRQVSRRMLLEVGYIGRLIHHEYIMKNPNAVPYMMTLGGQSFVSAYDAIETALGCTTSASACAKTTSPGNAIGAQPFFEAALGGSTSQYCSADSSCTAAVLRKQLSKFRAQQVFSLWQALDNNTNGAAGAGFTFARSLMGTATSNTTYGSAGQVVTGLSVGTSQGYSNYHGGYVTFKVSSFRGLTLQENLTFSKALGLGAYNQSTSSITAEDSYNLREQYGKQRFDQKLIFNTLIAYETPWFKNQSGIIGRLGGGWTLSSVLVAGTGSPLNCTSNNSGQNFGGEDGSNFTDNENCIFTTPYNGNSHTNRGVSGGVDPLNVSVGTTPKGTGSAAVNIFTNPVAVFDGVRPPILGIDNRDGGYGPISGLGYLNVDLSVRKKLAVWEKTSLEFTGVFSNLMNHLDFSNPSLSLQSSANWGTTKTQGNSPRQIQMGLRANF